MTRLRYRKEYTSKNTNHYYLVSSKRVMLPTGALVTIQLEPETNTYNFLSNGEVVSTGKASSLITLKKLVKDTLLAAGVKFETEKRNRIKTEVAA